MMPQDLPARTEPASESIDSLPPALQQRLQDCRHEEAEAHGLLLAARDDARAAALQERDLLFLQERQILPVGNPEVVAAVEHAAHTWRQLATARTRWQQADLALQEVEKLVAQRQHVRERQRREAQVLAAQSELAEALATAQAGVQTAAAPPPKGWQYAAEGERRHAKAVQHLQAVGKRLAEAVAAAPEATGEAQPTGSLP